MYWVHTEHFCLSARLSCVCLCVFVSSAAIVSSEQNPVIIIAVVAVAGTIILVFMVFGFIIGRRYALAGPIDSPLLWVCACQLAFLSLTGLHACRVVTRTHTCTHHLVACCANGLWCIFSFLPSPTKLLSYFCSAIMRQILQSEKALALHFCMTPWDAEGRMKYGTAFITATIHPPHRHYHRSLRYFICVFICMNNFIIQFYLTLLLVVGFRISLLWVCYCPKISSSNIMWAYRSHKNHFLATGRDTFERYILHN